MAHVRLGKKTKDELQKLAADIKAAWYRIVLEPHASEGKAEARKWELHSDWILALNVVGLAGGLPLPIAGQEAGFLSSCFAEFRRRADGGNDLMVDIVAAIMDRESLRERWHNNLQGAAKQQRYVCRSLRITFSTTIQPYHTLLACSSAERVWYQLNSEVLTCLSSPKNFSHLETNLYALSHLHRRYSFPQTRDSAILFQMWVLICVCG